jgi:uroporphyrinogen decarboxylase
MLMTTSPIDPSDSARHAALSVDPAARSDEDLRPETGSHLSADLRARSGMPFARTAASGLLSGDEDLSPASLTGAQRFLRACLRQPVDRTPVWFLRQAGRYMAEYQAVRRHHSLLEICKNPALAAEVTITAAEKLDVDAAIIFADLLLPFEAMGLPFEFMAGEGPVVHSPVRTAADVDLLRTDRAAELGYVGEALARVAAHFGDRLALIGFCGAPYTLASYMIEGGGSRNWVETKSLMYRDAGAWQALLAKLVTVLVTYCAQQVEGGADVIQIFDSWVGSLSVADYREFVLPVTTELVRQVQELGVPVIYFGVDTASLLPAMRETGADVIGLDWRVPLDEGWRALEHGCAVQGNLDPITLFAGPRLLQQRVREVLQRAGGRPGHIFNLGHGIVPGTPVENVQSVVRYVREFELMPKVRE